MIDKFPQLIDMTVGNIDSIQLLLQNLTVVFSVILLGLVYALVTTKIVREREERRMKIWQREREGVEIERFQDKEVGEVEDEKA